MHLESGTTGAPSPLPSPVVWHPNPLSTNSITDQSTVPCFVDHAFHHYSSAAHSQEIPTSDIVVVRSAETLPHSSILFHHQKRHNYSISLIPVSPRTDTHAPYTAHSAFQHAEELTQDVKLENSDNYTITDLPPVCNMEKDEYPGHSNLLDVDNGRVNNTRGRQSCLDDITALSSGTGCVYDSSGMGTLSGQFSSDQSPLLPPIASISAKHFHMQNEADVNVRNLSNSSLNTRRSSAKSDNFRGGNRALSASPFGDGTVDLTSLIRCSPTSLLAFSSSSCSQVSVSPTCL